MVVFGGFSEGYRNNQVYRLNLQSNTWEHLLTKGEPPCPRTGHSAVIYENYMIIFGGKNDENEKVNDVWLLDFKDNSWNQVIYKAGDI